MPAPSGPEVVIWTAPNQARLVGQVVAELADRICCIGVGGPRTTEVDQLASRLDCPREDDLRKLLVERPPAHLLVADSHGIDPADLRLALDQDAVVLGLEPLVAELAEVVACSRSGAELPWTLLPAFARCPGWVAAADPLQATGAIRQLRLTTLGQAADCSLLARLVDAWQTILTLAPIPLAIDASLIGPLSSVPEDVRGLAGHLTAHARLPAGGSVILHASDGAGISHRELEAIGETGHLRVSDMAYDLYDLGGNRLDGTAELSTASTFADLVTRDWRRLIEQPALLHHGGSMTNLAEVLACVDACRLSARTGQPESPGKLLQLQG